MRKIQLLFLVPLIFSMLFLLSACDDDEDTQENSGDPGNGGASFLLLNEIKANIPEDEHAYQYIELKGTPGDALNDTYLLAIDGDDDEEVSGENPGYLDFALSLDGITVGGNGLVLVKGSGQYTGLNTGATLVDSADIRTYDADVDGDQYADGIIEHDAMTFMLVYSPNQALLRGDDLDADDDGSLELPAGAEILDSLSWQNGGDGVVYSPVILTQSASDPDAATRFADNDTPISQDAWANGDVFEDPDKPDEMLPRETLYDPNEASANLPPNARLTPGHPNFGAAPFVLLNEVVANSRPSGSGEDEFIEIIANPGQSLDGVQVLSIRGESGGSVTYSRDLSGLSVGASGLLVIKNPAAYPEVADNTTVVAEPRFSGNGVLGNNGLSVLLVYAPGTPINVGEDLDSDDNGALERVGDSLALLDSVGWGIGKIYAESLLSNDGILPIPPMAASRYNGNRVVAASAWTYGALLIDGRGYDPELSKNKPENAFVTPGRVNVAELAAPQVQPLLETARTTIVPPDADDPAFWINPADVNASLVFATQKEAGYSIYDVNGHTLVDERPGEVRYNNVDVIYEFNINGVNRDLAVFTDRQTDKFAIYAISATPPYLTDITDPNSPMLFGGDPGENTAYGLAVYKSQMDGKVYAFATQNDSWRVGQYELQVNADGTIGWSQARMITLGVDDDDKHAEGMVVDQEYGTLIIAQEEVGIYTVDAEPAGDVTLTEDDLFVEEGEHNMVEDIEGISIYYKNDGSGYVIVSSQGSNTFGVFDRQSREFMGAFAVIDNGGEVDGDQHCDGLDVLNRPFGPLFPNGLLIVHDGIDSSADPTDSGTNFKWVKWEDVATAMGLDTDTGYDPRHPVNRR